MQNQIWRIEYENTGNDLRVGFHLCVLLHYEARGMCVYACRSSVIHYESHIILHMEMKDIYIIFAHNIYNGECHVMRDAYSSEEYALEAVERYRSEAKRRGDKTTMYSVGIMTLVK